MARLPIVTSGQQIAAYKVVQQSWAVCSRGKKLEDAGYSLHLSEEKRDTFVQQHWSRLPGLLPNEYEAPVGKVEQVKVDGTTYARLLSEQVIGLRFRDDEQQAMNN
jgi:hypothetical protein